MLLQANVVFLGVSQREYNGKIYRDANVEFEDGEIARVGVDERVCDNCKKYQRYMGQFRAGTSKNGMWMRLTGLVDIPAAPGK